tara:strand:+ start:409 stop:717 length:309 start_codon:yes stop_codon:yes gene_type:complete
MATGRIRATNLPPLLENRAHKRDVILSFAHTNDKAFLMTKETKPNLKNLFTAKEAAQLVGFSERHFNRLVIAAEIQPMYLNPRMRLFTKRDINALKKKAMNK